MALQLLIENGRVLTDSGWIDGCDVCVSDGQIERLGPRLAHAAAASMDASKLSVVPGFIDIHTHGAAGRMAEDASPDSVRHISLALSRCGVTGFLPTLAALPADRLRAAVAAIAAAHGSEPGARILGIHLEGPYLNPTRAGAQSAAQMRLPSMAELDALFELSGGLIRLVTVAPEIDGALDFIAQITRRGVVVALGHSAATEQQMLAAIDAGATHVTHLFNAMSGLHHRQTGVAEVALTDDRLSVEIICDGHHVAPRVIDMALRCKPRAQTALISDAVALGLADGTYELFGVPCVVADGAVRVEASGRLAGSCLSLDRAVRNLHAWLPAVPLADVLRAASTVPATIIRAAHSGRIAAGADADLVLLDAELQVVATIVRGEVVFPS